MSAGYRKLIDVERSVGRIRQFVPHSELPRTIYQYLPISTHPQLLTADKQYQADPQVVEAKYQAEYHLRSLPELEYTIIRPGGLTDKPAEGARMGKVGVGSTRYVLSTSHGVSSQYRFPSGLLPSAFFFLLPLLSHICLNTKG